MNDNLINLSICGLKISMKSPKWMLHENFEPFLCSIDANADISFEIIFDKPKLDWISEENPISEYSGASFYDHDGITYIIGKNQNGIISHATALGEWTSYVLFIDPFYNKPKDHDITNAVRNNVFVFNY